MIGLEAGVVLTCYLALRVRDAIKLGPFRCISTVNMKLFSIGYNNKLLNLFSKVILIIYTYNIAHILYHLTRKHHIVFVLWIWGPFNLQCPVAKTIPCLNPWNSI